MRRTQCKERVGENKIPLLVASVAMLLSLVILPECIPSSSEFNVVLRILTPKGNPILGASVKVGTINAGLTGADGSVTVIQIPEGTYSVSVTWLGKDVSPAPPLVIFESRTYVLTATKIAFLQIQVVGAQNQGLGGSAVMITPTGTTTPIFTGVTDASGLVAVEVPYGSYDVMISSRGVEVSSTVMVTGDTLQKITTGIFIEIFGVSLTFWGFILYVIGIPVLVAICLFLLFYAIKRSRPTQLPPPPPPE